MGFCPYGAPGDRLWVRETWAPLEDLAENLTRKPPRVIGYWADKSVRWYRSDGTWFTPDSSGWNWNHDCAARRPSVHMPRWASRITLEITEVRVERVRDITLEDINAEGAPGNGLTGDPWQEFADLWNSLNAGGGFGWDKNPWVWVIGFRRAEP